MSKKTKETLELEEKHVHCLACDAVLRNHSILICADCLDSEATEFLKLAETIDPPKK